MKIKKLIYIIFISLFLSGCGIQTIKDADESNEISSVSKNEALDYLNNIREESYLNSLIENRYLDIASQAHAKYMALNRVVTHYEDYSNPGYYENSPRDRVLKAGYNYRILAEDVSGGEDNYIDSINDLLTSIYHRFALLNPYVEDIGLGNYDRYYAYDLASKEFLWNGDSSNIVIYPANNSNDSSPVFINNEDPNPLPNRTFSGNPVSIEFNTLAYDCSQLNMRSFSLWDDSASHSVDIEKVMDSSNDPNYMLTDCQFALFPKYRLDFGHKYIANFSYSYKGTDYRVSWRYKIPAPKGIILKLNYGERGVVDASIDRDYYIYCKPEEGEGKPSIQNWSINYSNGVNYKIDRYDPNTLHIRVSEAFSGDSLSISINGGDYKEEFDF